MHRSPVPIVIYSRADCHLCDEAKLLIEETVRAEGLAVTLQVVDVDEDEALRELYTNEVPVVFVAGKKAFKYRVDAEELTQRVRRAADRER